MSAYTKAVRTVAEIISIVTSTYTHVAATVGRGETYGALCILGGENLYPLQAHLFFGELPENGTRSFEIVREKAARLAGFPSHVSSWQSRHPEKFEYGGAVRIVRPESHIGILSWSSFPELVDEAYMLAVAVEARIMDEREAVYIASLSQNPHLPAVQKVIDYCAW